MVKKSCNTLPYLVFSSGLGLELLWKGPFLWAWEGGNFSVNSRQHFSVTECCVFSEYLVESDWGVAEEVVDAKI